MSPTSPDAPTAKQFNFAGLSVAKALYELIGVVVPGSKPIPPVVNVGLEVAATVELSSDPSGAFVKLDIKVIPDKEFQPYRIEVTIGGIFTSPDATTDELLQFCRVAAPSILFPYVRETVYRLTLDAPHGVVRMNPVNISQILNAGGDWNVVTPEPGAATASTEP